MGSWATGTLNAAEENPQAAASSNKLHHLLLRIAATLWCYGFSVVARCNMHRGTHQEAPFQNIGNFFGCAMCRVFLLVELIREYWFCCRDRVTTAKKEP